MAPPRLRLQTSNCSLLLIYLPWKAELAWLAAHSGRFTHISGHPSAAGRAQDRESLPVKDRCSTTVPHDHNHGLSQHLAIDLSQHLAIDHVAMLSVSWSCLWIVLNGVVGICVTNSLKALKALYVPPCKNSPAFYLGKQARVTQTYCCWWTIMRNPNPGI